MQKTIRRLEKETTTWRQRCEGSNRSLIQMAEQKQADDARLLTQHRRIETLERLCRALQARAAGAGTGRGRGQRGTSRRQSRGQRRRRQSQGAVSGRGKVGRLLVLQSWWWQRRTADYLGG